MTEFRTRAMSATDLPRVVDLDAETGVRRRDFFHKRWQAMQTEPDKYISLVAEANEEIAGFVMAHVLAGEFGTDQRFAILDGLGVDKEARRSGIGVSLIDALKQASRQRNCSELRTQIAWQQRDLLAFFSGAGFVPAAVNVLECQFDQE